MRSPSEASAAVAGGADVIDAKEPDAGPLGAVPLPTFHRICAEVRGRRIVTAALGDTSHEDVAERDACAFAAAGAELVKLGFAGVMDSGRAAALTRAAVCGAGRGRTGSGLIVTAYADHRRAGSLDPAALIEVAADEGARGILIDTADKTGAGLIELISATTLLSWTNGARARGLLVALAGRLSADDLAVARRAGADVAGVRGAACEGGRGGQVERRLVERLRAGCEVPIEEIRPPLAASAGRRAGVQR